MKFAKMLFFLLLLALGMAACSSESLPKAKPAVLPVEMTITPTPQPVQIDLTINNNRASEDLSQWSARCARNTAGKPLSDLPEIVPYKAVVLRLNPKNNQWEFEEEFTTLLNMAGEPKYLVCVIEFWTQTGTYSTDYGNVPGYREDWKITVEDLDKKEIYETQTFVGQELPYSPTYQKNGVRVTEFVGASPFEEARSLLLSKQSKPTTSMTISVPFGYNSIDFAPDSRSLYIPFADGYRTWNFIENNLSPLSFQETPSGCKNGGSIRSSFDGKYLVTACYIGDLKYTTEIWSADLLKQTGKYDIEYSVDQQFEIQDQKRIISADKRNVTTLDISTGDLQVTPLKLEGNICWVSGQAKFAITYLQSKSEYQIWNLAEQKTVNKFGVGFEEMQLSRDGRLLILMRAQGGVTIQVRDVQTMQPVFDVVAEGYSTYAVSPDSRLLAVLTKGKIDIIDLQAKHLIQTIPVENPGSSILFSPDGKYIALPIGRLSSDFKPYEAVNVAVFSTGLP